MVSEEKCLSSDQEVISLLPSCSSFTSSLFRVSFMCKYAPTAVAAVMFLDPICFCLHSPRLTKQFVYHRADPGSTSHMIRTDVNVNFTIQRGFPWARISLFTEQIPCVPASIFLSENDALGK